MIRSGLSILVKHIRHPMRYDWQLLGITGAYGLTYLVYTELGDEIHFITARRAENWMVTVYDERRSRK